jgi:hypothetical protein
VNYPSAPFADLRHPSSPCRRLPLDVRRLLPDPCNHLDGWQRYSHQDLPLLSHGQLRLELAQLRLLSMLHPEHLPAWIAGRVRLLSRALDGGAKVDHSPKRAA